MNRNIAKPFTATLSLLDVASDKTHKYKCFHGEDIQLTVNVMGENNRRIDLSNTNVKIYFTLDKNVNEPVYRQDTGIVVDNLGIITVMLEKSYIRIGNNVLKIALYDEDQTVFLQPLIISCIDPLIGEVADLEIPDDINVRDEIYDIRRIIGYLQDFDSQLDTKVSILETYLRKRTFKPRFGISSQWGGWDLTENKPWIYDIEEIKKRIDQSIEQGVEEYCITVQVFKNSENEYVIGEDLDVLLEACEYLKSREIAVRCVKVHCKPLRTEIVADGADVSTLKEMYKNILTTVADKFTGVVDMFVVMNEFKTVYTKLSDFVVECLQLAQNKGFKSGVTTENLGENINLPSIIKENSSFIASNFYPSISYKGANATKADAVLSVEYTDVVEWIENNLKVYPDKEVYITETGCSDKWCSLAQPWIWNWGTVNGVNQDELTGGHAQAIMLYGLMETLKDTKLSSMWQWYALSEEPTKEVIKSFTGGI